MIILAYDPGPRETGIIVRSGEALLGADVAVRKGKGIDPDGAFLREVVATGRNLATATDVPEAEWVVSVEGVRYWHQDVDTRRRKNLQSVIATGMVYGAILLRFPNAIRVEPGKGYGQQHPTFYPERIRPPGPPYAATPHDLARHCRSAWDQSYVAETDHNRRARGVPQ